MPPQNMQNTGSFAAQLGDVSALKQAMERRGIDTSVLDQVSAAAPTGPTPTAPPVPETSPQIGTMAPAPSPRAGVGEPQKVPFRSGEAEIALRAMQGVIKTESKIAEAIVGLGRR